MVVSGGSDSVISGEGDAAAALADGADIRALHDVHILLPVEHGRERPLPGAFRSGHATPAARTCFAVFEVVGGRHRDRERISPPEEVIH